MDDATGGGFVSASGRSPDDELAEFVAGGGFDRCTKYPIGTEAGEGAPTAG